MNPVEELHVSHAPAQLAEVEFHSPSTNDFWLPLFEVGGLEFTRGMLVIVLVTGLLVAWMLWAAKRAAVVPSKGMFVTEGIYNFARNDIARDLIGGQKFKPYLPLIFSLFVFVLVNNLLGVIPPVQMPTMSSIAFPLALTLVVYLTYHVAGIKQHGLVGYLKTFVPSGLPAPIVPVVFLLEFVSKTITQPLTLVLRLFGNMLAGHMALALFIMGGWFLVNSGPLMAIAGAGSWIMGLLMTFFEILIQCLQAYVFTLLSASYIGAALADDH
ncbi:ATP synthase F0 subcomplex A subunit [Kytococcus aerolatus]|uniref:ATP synthase subunit a n=1 Tax=Kytococcus aerolatus TaxID=592308 RepID=A0A212T687_9MICO|nr:ATP synthase F0 subcomplex A subunit [Kytococcus aerolatus]